MLITREMDYALRILRALNQSGRLSAAAIAEREHMSQPITYKLLKQLTKAGILDSRRGTDGGYLLRRPCGELTTYDLFHALGEDLLIKDCLDPAYTCQNNACGHCRANREFHRIQQVLDTELRRTPLTELFQQEY